MLTAMYDYYINSGDFNEYVNKYAKCHGIDIINALKCELVKQTYKYYISENRK